MKSRAASKRNWQYQSKVIKFQRMEMVKFSSNQNESDEVQVFAMGNIDVVDPNAKQHFNEITRIHCLFN